MRRLFVPLLAFLVLLAMEGTARVLELTIPPSVTWPNVFQQLKAERIEDLAGRGVEVVFSGSSVAQADFDPGVFVASTAFDSAYNAAIPAASPRMWRRFTADTVHRHLCPDLVVIGVDIRQYNDNRPGTRGQIRQYLKSPGRRRYVGTGEGVTLSFWERSEDILESVSALFRLRPRLRQPDKAIAWLFGVGEWRGERVAPDGRYRGFDSVQFHLPTTAIEDLRRTAFLDFEVGGGEEGALKAMVMDAQERGSQVVLVIMPALYRQLEAALPNGADDVEAFRQSVRGVGARTGAPVLELPSLEDRVELFADLYHMNGLGSKALTEAVAQQVRSLGLRSGVCSGA